MRLDALDHPKTLDFASRLGVCLPQAIGHLELFWAFVAKKAPRGDVGKWPDGAISMAAMWSGDPHQFVSSLHQSGLIDASKTHRFVVHDWKDHMPNWVRAKLKKLNLQPLNADVDDFSGDLSGDLSSDLSGYSVREGKGREGLTPPTPHERGDLFVKFWKAYPRKVGKGAAEKAFAKHKPDSTLVNKMVEAVNVQKRTEQWQRERGKFIPHPATWLNQRRWEDEPEDSSDPYSVGDLDAD